jgi:hypothetical protein
LTGQDKKEWLATFRKSDAGKARLHSRRTYSLDIEADGSFTIDDVPPGAYELSGTLFDPVGEPFRFEDSRKIGSVNKNVAIPESADGQSAPDLDLGAVTVTQNESASLSR